MKLLRDIASWGRSTAGAIWRMSPLTPGRASLAERRPTSLGAVVNSLRREILDHVLLLGEQKLEDVARQYALYFNKARLHQGIAQRITDAPANDNHDGKIIGIPVLGCLHHDYRRAA